VHVGSWPQEHAQHPSAEHPDLSVFSDGIFVEDVPLQTLGRELLCPADRGPPPFTAADGCTGRAGEGAVRAGRLVRGHAPSLARRGRPGGSRGGRANKNTSKE